MRELPGISRTNDKDSVNVSFFFLRVCTWRGNKNDESLLKVTDGHMQPVDSMLNNSVSDIADRH